MEVKPITVSITADNLFPVTNDDSDDREFTLTATEFDTSNPDTDLVSFEMEVLDGDTELEISGLTSPVYEGQQTSFTVTGSNIPTISSYEIEVNAYAGENSEQSTTNSDRGFDSGCIDV